MSKYKGRQFLAIDGERAEGRYVLLQDSRGGAVENIDGLSSLECIEFLARRLPGSASWTRVGFGLALDVNHWISDLPQDHRIRLMRGHPVQFGAYVLTWTAGRIFRIEGRRKPGGKFETLATIYDCLGMFRRPFAQVCEEWLGSCPEIIREGKERRSTFTRFDLEFMREYNRAECDQLVQILDKVRVFLAGLPGGGVHLRSWYGAGAIASNWLRRCGVRMLMRELADENVKHPIGYDLLDAFERAYHGGRVESRYVGSGGPLMKYDINSAYAWAATHLGRITYRWVYADKYEPMAKMGVWLVRWDLPVGTAMGPLPWRSHDGKITYPLCGYGWYWWPEVEAARKRWGRRIKVERGYYCLDGNKPVGVDDDVHGKHGLGTVLKVMYQYRHTIRETHPAGARLLKLALAAIWGKFAQRVSANDDDDTPGFYYCLPWAGWITSCVRATILAAINGREEGVISVSTDGIVALGELDVPINNNLGGWKVEHIENGTFLLPGLYRLQGADGTVHVEKSRGYERTSLDWEQLLDELHGNYSATVKSQRFIGHLLPDLWPDQWEKHRLQFTTITQRIQPAAIGNKRAGGTELYEGFNYRTDGLMVGVVDGSQNLGVLSYPMMHKPELEQLRDNAQRDGDEMVMI